MELQQLRDILRTGAKFPITCKIGVEEIECSLDEGMKGNIISVRKERDSADVVVLKIDMTDFVEYNDPLMKKNFYNNDGVPCLNAKQADWYPKDNIETVYIDVEDFAKWFDRYFDHIDNNALFQEWRDTGMKIPYVNFLENIVIHMRSEIL